MSCAPATIIYTHGNFLGCHPNDKCPESIRLAHSLNAPFLREVKSSLRYLGWAIGIFLENCFKAYKQKNSSNNVLMQKAWK